MDIVQIIIFIAIGIVGGILGGMGMGGGTLLIPLLVIFAKIDQHLAQSINLIAFIPMSIVAIIIHAKNKLINYKSFFFIAIPAVVAGVATSFLARNVSGEWLRRYFGIFLLVLGVFQLVCSIINIVKSKKEEKSAKSESK